MFVRVLKYLKTYPLHMTANFLALVLLLTMAEFVLDPNVNFAWDEKIRVLLNTIRTPQLNHWVELFTDLNSMTGVAIFSVIVLGILLYYKWFKDIQFYLFSVIGASLAFVAIKYSVQRMRPSLEIVDIGGYSFPSGHTTLATATSLVLYFIFIRRLHSKILKILLFIICLVWPLLIAASRVYLDVHWLSDVLAGLGLGVFWVTLLTFFFQKDKIKRD